MTTIRLQTVIEPISENNSAYDDTYVSEGCCSKTNYYSTQEYVSGYAASDDDIQR